MAKLHIQDVSGKIQSCRICMVQGDWSGQPIDAEIDTVGGQTADAKVNILVVYASRFFVQLKIAGIITHAPTNCDTITSTSCIKYIPIPCPKSPKSNTDVLNIG